MTLSTSGIIDHSDRSDSRHGARDDFAVFRRKMIPMMYISSLFKMSIYRKLLSTTRYWDKSSNDKQTNKQTNKQTKIQTKTNLKMILWHVHKISSQILRTLRQTQRRLASLKKSDKGSQSCLKRASSIHFVIFIPRKRSSIRFGPTWATLVLKTLAGMFKPFVCDSFFACFIVQHLIILEVITKRLKT